MRMLDGSAWHPRTKGGSKGRRGCLLKKTKGRQQKGFFIWKVFGAASLWWIWMCVCGCAVVHGRGRTVKGKATAFCDSISSLSHLSQCPFSFTTQTPSIQAQFPTPRVPPSSINTLPPSCDFDWLLKEPRLLAFWK